MKSCLIKSGSIMLSILALILLYGLLIEPRVIDLEHETAVVPGLPAAWEGKRVAVIADFQVGMWLANTGTIRRAALRLVEEQPEAVLMLGDFVYHPVKDPDREVQKVMDLIRPLTESDIPLYAVLGNHDYAMSGEEEAEREQVAQRVHNALERAGVRVLHNEAAPMQLRSDRTAGNTPGEARLYLVGLGASYPDEDLPDVALSQLPENSPRIVMMHNPDSFEKLPAHSAPLAATGHTHGGQIRVPFMPEWSWIALTQEDEVHADGWIEGYGAEGNRLYVNRGIGFSLIPVRINCPPEVTLFTLHGR